MSDTPRTDAASGGVYGGSAWNGLVELASQLERELAAKERELTASQLAVKLNGENADRLAKELAEARDELKRIECLVEQKADIREIHFKDGKLDLALSHPLVFALTCEMASYFKSAKGINYCGFTVYHDEIGKLCMTLQRCEGKTPAELKAEAEAELSKAHTAIRGAVLELDRARQTGSTSRINKALIKLRSCLPASTEAHTDGTAQSVGHPESNGGKDGR